MSNIKKYIKDQLLDQDDFKNILSLVRTSNRHSKTNFIFLESDGKSKNELALLYYEDLELRGVLCIYNSYHKNHVRIHGVVHPKYRNKGIFSELYIMALNDLKQTNIEQVTFIIEDESGIALAKKHRATYQYSSYKMDFHLNHFNLQKLIESELIIKEGTIDDLEDLVEIGMDGFGTSEEEERPLMEENLSDTKRYIYIAKKENQPIGMISVTRQESTLVISDLVIKKGCRKMGYGTELLCHVIKSNANKKEVNLSLNVNATNKEGLSLYKRCGFRVSKNTYFYSLNIS
ncbi:GNAT family N-acetyltransferase [Haloplasma contractile]|uniref:Acetyltransferase domain containing protein n=1 Tax=Haloplasma contractile SSD-17B TaxID=1033810 RepID=U2E7N3_9MOLU|nr:GNAT family N-acetyltransferase [Haloplasma contractile]ERJ10911.1 Acetyltransferase domain containing protein [Haloplasma contractile SSD-17B]